jgi:uncharacterized membrane protein
MKPLIVLLGATVIAAIIIRIATGIIDIKMSGRFGMAAMLLFTGIGHFVFTKGMTMMMPAFVPFKRAIVYGTGLLEWIAAAALLVPAWQAAAGWFLLVFFVLLLPANIYAALRGIDYQQGTNTGPGKKYLLFRVPLQAFFIAWAIWCAL